MLDVVDIEFPAVFRYRRYSMLSLQSVCYQVNAGQAIIQNISEGDNEGRKTYEVTYQLAESALGASDNLTIVFD